MKRVGVILIVATLVGCGGGGGNGGGDGGPDPMGDGGGGNGMNVAGRHDHSLDVDGLERTFIVYVPENAAGTTPVPVVFVLHGTSQSADEFFDNSGWTEKADEVGAIIVYPDALTHCYLVQGNRQVATKWAAGELGDTLPLCDQADLDALTPDERALADHPLADDVAFIDAVVDFLGASYAVDPARLYLSGFSNGASMVQRLMVERSTVFAAGAANAGALRIAPAPAERPYSLFFAIGNEDEVVFDPAILPLPMDQGLADQQDFHDRFIAPNLTAMQLADDHSVEEVAMPHHIRWTYDTSTAGASNVFEVYLVEGMAHVYPDPMPDLLWTFFEPYAL